MVMKILDYFKIERKPKKGLFAFEQVMIAYLLFTVALMLVMDGEFVNPKAMLYDRLLVLGVTLGGWLLYRLYSSPLMRLARVVGQMVLLAVWYPDTYEFNRLFPNLDHLFVGWEQTIFGFQPSLVFAQEFSHKIFSELMCLGYAAYYPMIGAVAIFAFCARYDRFMRTSFIILGSFYIYYVIYIFLPVVGPQYYYPAAGMENIAAGVFPNLGDYFYHMRSALPTPGEAGGVFHQMVVDAHNAGERPTAAFPSSHVGVTTILMLLARNLRSKGLFYCLLPFYVLMCFATVYIYAHYAIDVFAGWLSAVVIYGLLHFVYTKFVGGKEK